MSKPLDFDKSLEKLGVLFRFSGMNLQNKIETLIDIIKYRWLFTFNFILIITSTFGLIFCIIIDILNGKDIIEVTSVAPCLSYTLLGIFKSIFHLIYEGNLQELITVLRNLEIQENNREKCIEKEKIIAKEVAFLNRVINVLYALNCSMIVVFDMTPLTLIAIKYYKTQEFDMLLPYLDVFKFIPNEIKYWPFAYVHQIWAESMILMEVAAADYLLFTCCTYIRIQFKLLQYDIERSIPSRSIFKGEIFEETEFQKKFVKLVQWHHDLIQINNNVVKFVRSSANILEIIYSKSTLFNFMCSSFMICLTGFNVTIVDDIVTIIVFFTFLIMALMQVFFICFFADMMMRASMEVSDGVYNSRWYLAKPAVGKQLLLVQTRAQEPCKLTAAGFADVNLRAYMRVLSTAWSYFALLQTLYGG